MGIPQEKHNQHGMGWMDKQMDRKVKQFTLRISSHNYGD
jgi:hypothetical protein